ncbi:hypothetical protein QYM36_010196 [Artemia franciscana]|uniref:Copper transport protein ATOX1 n=1 Tax=Artemia franciscana TaxID=6661 RepID=A0AA88HWK0_ARTSF|nr:hypothetical protein QYM36_010196 [Artemia franciscana]
MTDTWLLLNFGELNAQAKMTIFARNYIISAYKVAAYILKQRYALEIHEFKVAMSCEGCSGAVERVLGKLKGQGVNNVDIDLPGQKVYVDSTLPEDFLLGTIKKTGKETVYIGLKQ